MQPEGTQLAQLNVGRLVAMPGDPRVAEFMAALDLVNQLGRRSAGFVWMMEGSGAPGRGNTETTNGCDPRCVSNLTVWENAASLERFVFTTLHRRFYERRAEWFDVLDRTHFVMWWVPRGDRPTLDEALRRLDHLQRHGDSDHAFGWSHLNEARLWRSHACAPIAAE